MDFNQLAAIKDEQERVNRTYEIFNEDKRLNRSQAARVEFLTTMHYLEQRLHPEDRIMDIGAGAGEYSLTLARQRYPVTAVELSDQNIQAFQRKITPDLAVDLHQGTALDLSAFPENSYDIVLLMGPLYHLENKEDQLLAIRQAKRICKDNGLLLITFISNDMVILTEFGYDQMYFNNPSFNRETFAVDNFPFVFHTLDQAKQVCLAADLEIEAIVAQDGVSELMEDKINQLDDAGYQLYLDYHMYCAEKPEMLGRTNHLLFICRNR